MTDEMIHVEVIGGPEDGTIITLPPDAFDIHWPIPAIISTQPDPTVAPSIQQVTFDIHERPDGSLYILWWEAE